MRVFDVHRHIGLLGQVEVPPLRDQVTRHLDLMDRLGIDQGLAMPSHAYPNPNGLADTRRVNDQVATVVEEYGDRFPVGLGTVEPMYGEPAIEEVDRAMTELELDGLSWHNRWQRSKVDSPLMYDLIDRAAEHDAVVLLHAYAESDLEAPWRIFRVIEAFPDVAFVVVDAFSGTTQARQVAHWAADVGRDNVWFDISGAKHVERQLVPFADRVGIESLVFGAGGYSDSERTSIPLPIEQIERSSFSDAERHQLFWDNAARLLAL